MHSGGGGIFDIRVTVIWQNGTQPVAQSIGETWMEPVVDKSKLLGVNEIADWLQVPPSWVYAHADELGAYRLGKYLRFEPSRVLERLREGPVGRSIVNPPTPRPPLTPIQKATSDGHGTN